MKSGNFDYCNIITDYKRKTIRTAAFTWKSNLKSGSVSFIAWITSILTN